MVINLTEANPGWEVGKCFFFFSFQLPKLRVECLFYSVATDSWKVKQVCGLTLTVLTVFLELTGSLQTTKSIQHRNNALLRLLSADCYEENACHIELQPTALWHCTACVTWRDDIWMSYSVKVPITLKKIKTTQVIINKKHIQSKLLKSRPDGDGWMTTVTPLKWERVLLAVRLNNPLMLQNVSLCISDVSWLLRKQIQPDQQMLRSVLDLPPTHSPNP